ncbi:hypothetical protein ASG29_15785 [Sphingomonas sp. Leaf412]|uniref:hypothetical protein n=1 Tax=Sphingomonas sp. Leaf412 TaxID=1736370 RepID=UPI0006F2028B|nr:hypothetical protein [Sphingomonas sp. Leaf412]KQT31398.1 hypothetical protein ASG29_15785 [Sphingomonas sp. Leaf412]
MATIGRVMGWLGRKGLLYLALVGAILFYWSTRPSFESYGRLRDTAAGLQAGRADVAAAGTGAIDAANARVAAAGAMGAAALDARIAAATAERAPLQAACGGDLGALVLRGAGGVVENRRRCFQATMLTREIDTLRAIRGSVDARRPGETVDAAIARHRRVMARAAAIDRAARAKLAILDGDYVPDFLQRTDMAALRVLIASAGRYHTTARRNVEALTATQRGVAGATQAAGAAMTRARDAYAALTDERARALTDNRIEQARTWAEANEVPRAMRAAGIALLLILAMPLLIRLFCYYVLAPVAMRRAAIRLAVPGGAGVAIPPADRSATSVGVRLDEGWEVLVRQDYLQTTSHAGAKGTQWLLDWRHPFASVVTGLTFLTRIRGAGEVTTVSATRDPFAEVTVVDLPDGAACVLHPRALAAVAQPIGRALRVTSHWRLGSLNAWLTLQLRYLVFHGPARLVVKGGRGVRVERAERGRVFGQDQLVGFSADLAYSVTRTETFWPYLLGRESLLKDRVEAGGGVLIVEEAPFAGRRAGPARGIEGMIDAGLKMFGM